MTLLEKAYLEAECPDCEGTGWVTIGRFDEEEVVECLCRKEARAEKEAEGREE